MSDPSDESAEDLPQQLRVRREKYDRLAAEPAHRPFPAKVARTASLASVRAEFPNLPAGAATDRIEGVTGRVIFIRNTGKLCFAMLREGEAELQIMLSLDRVGEHSLAAWKSDVDLGDLVFVHGEIIASQRGELSVLADDWLITAKALRPLPVAHKPLSDETRVRQRYVDLIVRPDARRMVRQRAAVLRSLRATLDSGDFVEVETPVLQAVHGGAAARPFRTHLNAFDLDMSLRIATELYLKRCVVGGLERVYEIGPVFRNEGIDSSHSPEYTLLEAYEAYGDYHTIAELIRRLVLDAADAVGVERPVTVDGLELDLAGDWRWVTVHDAVSEVLGEQIDVETDVETLRRYAQSGNVPLRPGWTAGEIVLELYEKLVEHTLQQPTFVCNYPVDVRPLARPHRDDPRLTEALDLVIGGVEIAPAYSELVDPVEQRRRLIEQSRAAAGGDSAAMEMDEEFLAALEYGMPPTGGLGLGVDRLLMVLTGRGIRETILFPLLKPL